MTSLEELKEKAHRLNLEKKYADVVSLLTDDVLQIHRSADLYAERADAHYGLNEKELCDKYNARALEINPKHSNALNIKGARHWDKKEYEQSITAYKESLESNPAFSYSLNGLGNVYYELRDYDTAIQYFLRAAEGEPKFSYPYDGLGAVYTAMGEYDKAIIEFQRAIEIDPGDAYHYNELGNIYYYKYEYEKGIEQYQKAITLSPQYAFAYNGLANCYLALNRIDSAIEQYKNAISLDPNLGYAQEGLGMCYQEKKEYVQAIECFENAIKPNPSYASPYIKLANVHIDLKNYEEAKTAYDNYFRLSNDPQDYYAQQTRARLSELKTIIESEKISTDEYFEIEKLVNNIRRLLLFGTNADATNGNNISAGNSNNGSLLVTHYTSLSGAKAMILEESCLRLSECAFLNDTSEGKELFNFLNFDAGGNKHLVIAGKDAISVPFAQKPFILSFVAEKKHNNLTLWRMYGKEEKEEAGGCAITIDGDKLISSLQQKIKKEMEETQKQNNKNKPQKDRTGVANRRVDEDLRFFRVAYRSVEDNADSFKIPDAREQEEELNKQMTTLKTMVEDIKNKSEKDDAGFQKLMELLNSIAYLFKSDEYQHEHELRLIVRGYGFKKKINDKCYPPKVYVESVAINPMVRKITLGPKVARAEEWATAFYHKLYQDVQHSQPGSADVFEPSIIISQLPFK